MLKIFKNGAIQGGEANWNYDESLKAIHFSGWVKIKFGPFKKSVNFDNHYHVERENLLSANVKQGMVIDLENGGKLEVLSVAAGRALAQITSSEYSGIIEFDITGELIDPIKVNLKANYSGIKLTIHAEKV